MVCKEGLWPQKFLKQIRYHFQYNVGIRIHNSYPVFSKAVSPKMTIVNNFFCSWKWPFSEIILCFLKKSCHVATEFIKIGYKTWIDKPWGLKNQYFICIRIIKVYIPPHWMIFFIFLKPVSKQWWSCLKIVEKWILSFTKLKWIFQVWSEIDVAQCALWRAEDLFFHHDNG